jgi:hypothetical protein
MSIRESRKKMLIHATFADSTTMLFRLNEKVWTCTWMSDDGEHFSGVQHDFAEDLIKVGVHVVARDARRLCCGETNAKIIRVRKVSWPVTAKN